MPKLVHIDPKYRKHKQSGRAIVRIAGRDILLPGKHGSKASKTEYHRLLAEHAVTGAAPAAAAEKPPITITELIAAYWRHCQTRYRNANGAVGREVDNIRGSLRIVAKLYGNRPACEFGPVALAACRADMLKAGWSHGYIRANVGRIRRMFRWASSVELIPRGHAHDLSDLQDLAYGEAGVRETAPVAPADDKDIDATLPFLHPTLQALVKLQRLTGARSGELCIMRPADIDRSVEPWTYSPVRHKNLHRGHARVIRLGPQARTILSPLIVALKPDDYVFSPQRVMEDIRQSRTEARVTPATYGNTIGSNRRRKPKRTPGLHYTTKTYAGAVTVAIRKAQTAGVEVEHWFPHRIRHRVATELRSEAGADAARLAMGHKTMDATAIYAEADGAKLDGIVERYG